MGTSDPLNVSLSLIPSPSSSYLRPLRDKQYMGGKKERWCTSYSYFPSTIWFFSMFSLWCNRCPLNGVHENVKHKMTEENIIPIFVLLSSCPMRRFFLREEEEALFDVYFHSTEGKSIPRSTSGLYSFFKMRDPSSDINWIWLNAGMRRKKREESRRLEKGKEKEEEGGEGRRRKKT